MSSKLKYYMRGLGIGIMVTALILAIVNINNRKNKGMTDAEIMARAQELGMVNGNSYSLTDADKNNSGASQDANNQGTVDQEPTNQDSTGTSNQNTTGTEDNTTGSDQTTVTDGQTGDSQGADNQAGDGQGADGQTGDSQGADGQTGDGQGTDGQTGDGQGADGQTGDGQNNSGSDEEQKPSEDNKEDNKDDNKEDNKEDNKDNIEDNNVVATGEEVSITVSAGSGSEVVAASLAKAGLVSDAKEFNNYMVNNGYSRKIRVGTFKIPMGTSYEDICKILTGK